MTIEAMKLALEALEMLARYENPETRIQVRKPKDGGPIVTMYPHKVATDAADDLRTAIEQAEKQEQAPVAYLCENAVGHKYFRWKKPSSTYKPIALYTTSSAAQRQPLIDSVRHMRDIQGVDGTWNYDPYMHGLYNGLEFAVSLLEQREPQFKDAPEKWLSDLPKPRIFSATEAARGIGEKK
jgi:hypothetical protein